MFLGVILMAFASACGDSSTPDSQEPTATATVTVTADPADPADPTGAPERARWG